MPCLRTLDTKKSLGVEKSSYDVVCAANSSISTCFRCAKKLGLIGRTILPIAQSIEATIVDWDGYIYSTYIHTYIQTHCETAHRDYPPRLKWPIRYAKYFRGYFSVVRFSFFYRATTKSRRKSRWINGTLQV